MILGGKFNGKQSKKRCIISVEDRKIKRLCLQDRKISSVAITSDLNYTDISVDSRPIMRRLTDVELRGRIP